MSLRLVSSCPRIFLFFPALGIRRSRAKRRQGGNTRTACLSHEGEIISEEALGKAYPHLLMRVHCLLYPLMLGEERSASLSIVCR
ncbi:hypothetical protein OPV22_001597 [Ensete ventricosum]|uniref:Secreted protein n=1 Tax=Ensete ventricosum TaxID=4639 RepID=A0AAV8RUY5_ENSVE|nr:hypothetical protein OPV22_001597 [Ensete ventricosum]